MSQIPIRPTDQKSIPVQNDNEVLLLGSPSIFLVTAQNGNGIFYSKKPSQNDFFQDYELENNISITTQIYPVNTVVKCLGCSIEIKAMTVEEE